MIYPNFIKEKDTIGVTAPSNGQTDRLDLLRIDNAYKKLKELGYNIKETPNIRTSYKGRSSPARIRAKKLLDLYKDKDIKLIVSAKGGDFMIEILPYLDFNIIKNNPKWFQGCSDNTILTYTITTNLDIATIYGENISSYGMEPYHKSIEENLDILTGKNLKQNSYPKYQDGFIDYKTGLEPIRLDKKVNWINLYNKDKIEIEGRLIGGCLDVIVDLIGTKYDKTKEFIEKYKKDGIIWYLENFGLDNDALFRKLTQLKYAGYFQYTKGIIFGRTLTNTSYNDISYEESVSEALKDLNIPVIIETDFGHKPPRFTIINGSYTKISSSNGKGTIKYILK